MFNQNITLKCIYLKDKACFEGIFFFFFFLIICFVFTPRVHKVLLGPRGTQDLLDSLYVLLKTFKMFYGKAYSQI